MPGRLLPAQASFHLLLGSDYSPWRGMDSVWTGSWGHCPCVGGGKPFSIHLPADFQPALACSSLWLQAGECSGSWSWHWASVAVTPQREQAAFKDRSATGQREFKHSRRALHSYGNCSSFRQMSAGNGNQLWRPRGDITGLLGNYPLAVPRMKGCDCCFLGCQENLPASSLQDGPWGPLERLACRTALRKGWIALGTV